MKKNWRMWALIGAGVVLLVTFIVAGTNKSKQRQLYSEADGYYQRSVEYRSGKKTSSIYDEEDYLEKAIEKFEELQKLDPEYEDVEDRILTCKLALGETYINKADFEKAYLYLQSMRNEEEEAVGKLMDRLIETWSAYIMEKIEYRLSRENISIPDLTIDSIVVKQTGSSKYGPFYNPFIEFSSEIFSSFSDEKKLTVLVNIYEVSDATTEGFGITSKGARYSYKSRNTSRYVIKDGKEIYEGSTITGNTSGSTSSGSRTCPLCHGSGLVKYYYGSSDLEAYLDGEDPYTVGKCTMCNGTGKVRD